jgi:type IV secretory pathway VirJ component
VISATRHGRWPALIAMWLVLVAASDTRLSHGRFENVTLHRPTGAVRQVVLLLSGDDGWNAETERMATALTIEGALVVGLDTPPLLRSFSAEGGECVYPDGDLENLSHWVQGYAHLPTYFAPLLVGYGSGAGLAYAALAQAPAATFGGLLSVGFCPHLAMDLPPCDGGAVPPTRRGPGHGVELAPVAHLGARWIALQGETDRVCPMAKTAAFVAHTAGAEMRPLPRVGHALGDEKHWMSSFLAAYRALAVPTTASVPPPPTALTDLPLIEVPAEGGDPRFAILLSGDGGWAGLDKEVAAALAARGIPVVGWDSLRYFWTARTPEGLAADLDRVVRFYADHWHRAHALLIGYSQGADVLPFALDRLPAATRPRIAHTVLMGLGAEASFEFHVGNWIGNDDEDALPIRPVAEKLSAATTLCLYGEDETDSLCPRLGQAVRAYQLPGGHHFGGDYGHIADVILASTVVPEPPRAHPTAHGRRRATKR